MPITYNESLTLDDLVQTDEYILSQIASLGTITNDIITLQSDVLALQTSQSAQDITILAIQNDIFTLFSDNLTFSTTLQDHETRITTLETSVNTINNDQNTQNINILNNTNDIITLQSTISNLNLNSLADIDLSIPATINQILKYDGTNFVAANESTGSNSLAALTDVDINTPNDGDILSYNQTTTKWENNSLSLTPQTLEYFQV